MRPPFQEVSGIIEVFLRQANSRRFATHMAYFCFIRLDLEQQAQSEPSTSTESLAWSLFRGSEPLFIMDINCSRYHYARTPICGSWQTVCLIEAAQSPRMHAACANFCSSRYHVHTCAYLLPVSGRLGCLALVLETFFDESVRSLEMVGLFVALQSLTSANYCMRQAALWNASVPYGQRIRRTLDSTKTCWHTV